MQWVTGYKFIQGSSASAFRTHPVNMLTLCLHNFLMSLGKIELTHVI